MGSIKKDAKQGFILCFASFFWFCIYPGRARGATEAGLLLGEQEAVAEDFLELFLMGDFEVFNAAR